MKRRDFIAMLGGGAVYAIPSSAKPQGRLPTIGFLGTGSSAAGGGPWAAAFVQRLRELGWIDGQTATIVFRWAEGRMESYAETAAEFVRLKVDVIVSFGAAMPAMKRATSVIPLVFTIDADPVGRGLVASLARPGGNVTGLSAQTNELVGKRLELVREIIPDFRRLAVLTNVDFFGSAPEVREIRRAAGVLGIDIVDMMEVRRPEDIERVFAALSGRAQVLYVCGDNLTNTLYPRINALALRARLPAIWNNRVSMQGGGLISYGVDFSDLHRRAGDYVDKILRGAKPADIPVEQPRRFELVISLPTAKALGVTVPPSVLARADEVAE